MVTPSNFKGFRLPVVAQQFIPAPVRRVYSMMSESSKMSFQHLCGFPAIHYVHLIQSSLYEKLLCEGLHSPIYFFATTIVGPGRRLPICLFRSTSGTGNISVRLRRESTKGMEGMSAGVMHCEDCWPTHNTCVYVEAQTEQGTQMRHTFHAFRPPLRSISSSRDEGMRQKFSVRLRACIPPLVHGIVKPWAGNACPH